MTATWAVARRELFSLWVTPIAWLLLCAFLLVNGAAFVATLSAILADDSVGIDVGPIQAYFGQSIFVPLGYLLVCPLITMRTLAEERRSGTAELLLCAPISTGAIVCGKYLALAVTYVGMWLPTLLYAFVLRDTGHVEWQVVATSYVGAVGLGLGFLAIGLCMSSLTAHQLVAAGLTGTVVFTSMLCGVGEQIYQAEPLHGLLSLLSIQSHLSECAEGVLSLRRILYAATLVVLPLFVATRSVEHWRDS
jgi:ABC-2 type transport system permease protein